MIQPVTTDTLPQAAAIHSASWIASHRGLCSPAFLAAHTPARQKQYLEARIAAGVQFFLLTDGKPVGIVSVCGRLIEHLYILPDEQNKGYGSQLLSFAIGKCTGVPALWVLDSNDGAKRLYQRHGFFPTGRRIEHPGGVDELEFCLRRAD